MGEGKGTIIPGKSIHMMTQKLRKSFIPNFKHWNKPVLHLSERKPPVSQTYDRNIRHFQVYINMEISHRGISLLKKPPNTKMPHCDIFKHAWFDFV